MHESDENKIRLQYAQPNSLAQSRYRWVPISIGILNLGLASGLFYLNVPPKLVFGILLSTSGVGLVASMKSEFRNDPPSKLAIVGFFFNLFWLAYICLMLLLVYELGALDT